MLKSWPRFEKMWLLIFSILIISTTVIFSISGTDYSNTKSILLNWVISPVSAIIGIVCVVMAARGSIWTYAWGIVNCVTYGYLAYTSGYYGDMLLNLFYFLPFQFIGFVMWNKNIRDKQNKIVHMKKLSLKQGIYITAAGAIGAVAFGLLLYKLDNWFVNVMKRNQSIYIYLDEVFHIPFLGAILDSSTEVLQITAQILMAFAFAEQWIMWILTNVITIIMWAVVIIADPTSLSWALPTLIMWVAYLINSVYGYINWIRGAKKECIA